MAGAKGFSSSETTSETSAAFPPLVLMMVSAISIEAVERFFSHLPKASGFVFVIIAYGERRSPSTLTDRLRRCVGIPVHDVAENLRVEPDHVYLASPRCELVLQGDRLCPVSRGSEGLRHPADAFLRSLAEQRGEDAFGIVFPGAGDEGAVGLRAIKDQGGVTLAQPPEPAGQDQVLASAIAAGLMDWLLPAADMPAKLLALYRQSGTLRERALANAEIADQLEPICALLQRRTGHDFRSYKQGTLVRRIRRRMLLKQAATIADYLRNLEQDPGEAELAQRDLLIGVTQFFRDPEAFEVLAAQVLPELLEGRPAESPVRIWVPGCATGEEAYSIAMLVLEQLDRIDPSRRVQVFATDIDSEMLARARQGRYPGEIRAQVSDDRLERFFVREGGQVRVGIDLREACIFSGHSLVRDPPFSNLDLVSCRNVLIYFDPSLQKKVVPLLHYALRPGGFLFLGPTEGLAAHAELFSEVSRPHRLFRRNETTSRPRLEFPLIGQVEGRPASPRGSPGTAAIDRQLWVSQAFERMILNEFAPACAVVNERGDLFTSAGPTGLFLQAPAGAPSLNLLDQAQGTLGI